MEGHIVRQVPTSPRKTDKASISQLLNSAPTQPKPMLQVSTYRAAENALSPRSVLGLERFDPNVMSLPERGNSLGYGSMNMQPALKPAYFAATHASLTYPYFGYAGPYSNQALLHTNFPEGVNAVPFPRAPNYAHVHLSSDAIPIISPPLNQNLEMQSPLELQQKHPPHFVPFYSASHAPGAFSSSRSTADVPQMQPGVHMQNVTNAAMHSRYVLGLPAQMPSRIPSEMINYGGAVMSVPSAAYYYGPNNDLAQPELVPNQYSHIVAYSSLGQKNRRFRRRYHQIHRKYICPHEQCTKSYGSLNHLNTHIVTKKHGLRLSKAEFKRLYESDNAFYKKIHGSTTSDNACLSQDESESASGEEDKTSGEKQKQRVVRAPLLSALISEE